MRNALAASDGFGQGLRVPIVIASILAMMQLLKVELSSMGPWIQYDISIWLESDITI